MKQKLLRLDEVKIDKELYPRSHVDWITGARYVNALKSGASFPPITVAKLGKKYILVDGAHRLEAYKGAKETHIQAEVLTGLDKKQIFIESVKRNITHGRQFSTQEVTNIAMTFEKWEMSKDEISQIIRIPVDKIAPFIAKRITRITETQEEIALKAPLRHLSEGEVLSEPNQDVFSATSQVQIFDNLISLFKQGLIDTKNKTVVARLKKLYKLLSLHLDKGK